MHDLCVLEAMLNPLSMDNFVATQESESENELVSISGQFQSELVAQIPTVVENSSDIHVGPHLPYNDAVANRQYITVKGKDDIGSLAETPSKNAGTTSPHPPEGAHPVDAVLIHPSKDVLAFQKPAWLKNRYVWSSLVIVLVAASITAPAFALSESESKSVPTGTNSFERQHVVVCYVAEWAHTRSGLGRFAVENIDPTLCTHLVYAFANLNMTRNAIESMAPEYDLKENNGAGAYRKMTSLKEKYPHLKVLLAMGGWAERMNKNYSEVAESPIRRKVLITSISEYLRKYNFDGLDLHWQYPGEENGVPADKENFVSLLKELREEFDKFGLLLTAPLGVMPYTIEHSYNIPAVSQHLHYMFALCYAYHGHWEKWTGPNAPLYSFDNDSLSVVSTIRTLVSKGADRKKLVLGLPLYGRTFRLKSREENPGFRKGTEGPGWQGPLLHEAGFWGYNEICMEVDNPNNNWKTYWDNDTHTPYASKENQFISYDDARSLTEKVELAVDEKLAGVVVWSLDTDDFGGKCTYGKSGSTTYPLMRAINNAFNNSLKRVPRAQLSSASGPVNLGPTSAVIILMLWKNILCLY